MKRASLLALVIGVFLALLNPSLVQAQSKITIINNLAQAGFPFRLSFNLSAESEADITDIRLRYTVDRAGFAQVTSEVYLEFLPAPAVDVDWTWDMRKTGGIPLGTGLEYWWTVEDATGDIIKTAPIRVWFDDNRYSWQSLIGEKVTIYWYEGRQSFAEELMSAAQQVLVRLAEGASEELEVCERVGLIGNLSAQLDAGTISGNNYLATLSHFADDPDPQVREIARDFLEDMTPG